MHGHRQLVPRGVLLSQVTSETRALCCYFFLREKGTHRGPLALSQRKERATIGPHAPNLLGYTRATMARTMGRNPEKGRKSPKPSRSSDRGL